MTAIEERRGMIELRAVSKRFDGRRAVVALDGVDLAIGPGEFVAIIGPSGSGKSTLLNLMGVLDRPTSGDVLIDGQSIGALGDRDRTYVRRDKVGFIFQFFNLLPSLSAAQNVALPLHLRHWSRRKADARARELLAMVGLERRADHQPDELSGGERQRVAIARALSINPPILLGDEPTGNLDRKTGADILALLRDLHDRFGATVVIVTHDLTVAESCPRVVRMLDGRMVEDLRR
ncbi:MAG: ABC transporter ATP-binding protein [Vicinamibacterales bacterium]